MKKLLYLLLMTPLLFAAKCGEKMPQFSLNETIEMMPGQTMACDCGDMQLTFVEVKTDSRCPVGVNCIRAGEATVMLQVSGTTAQEVVLEIGAKSKSNPAVSVGDYQVRATQLRPYPVDGEKTESADYRLSLQVSEKVKS